MKPKIQVEFQITGSQKLPDEITDLLQIVPSRIWRENDSIQGTKLKRKENGWCLSLKDDENSIDLADYVLPLLKVLRSKSKVITQMYKEFDLRCEMSCAIYINDETPIINFTHEVIASLAELGAYVDIDIILTG
jgi:hypothetical protein